MRYGLVTIALMVTVGCTNARNPLQANQPPVGDSPLVADGQYEAVALGTLGGVSATPTAINDVGQIAGVSHTLAGVAHAFLWQNGVMRDLGTIAGGESEAHAINANGQVAGANMANGYARVFLWDNGVMRDLGPDGARFVVVRLLTESGDVVATVSRYDGRVSSVLWRAGVMQDLGNLNPAEPETYAYAADDAGLVAGQSIAFVSGPTAYYHPVLWDGSQLRDLGVLGPTGDAAYCAVNFCSQGLAADVNGAGQVVGWTSDSADLVRGYLWDRGALRDLGAFPGRLTWAVSINDRGQVAGEYSSDFYSHLRAFVWEGGTARDLGTLAGGRTGVLAINEEGRIAGYSRATDGEMHAFVWNNGRIDDLGLGLPTALNDRGDIVGVASIPLGPQNAMLWRRVLSPAPLATTPHAPKELSRFSSR